MHMSLGESVKGDVVHSTIKSPSNHLYLLTELFPMVDVIWIYQHLATTFLGSFEPKYSVNEPVLICNSYWMSARGAGIGTTSA